AEHGVEADLELRRVESIEEAEHERFLGSPTVRVDGVDVEPGADERTDFGLKCRIYRTGEGASGAPPRAWIEAAIAAAGSGKADHSTGRFGYGARSST
ncbi:MAG: hypothetical protein JST31_08625, partial [Actinobacteria bacterium]|nr:hypothetical protein [Actinomycetota bacterium]